jgi:hypothetical protein
MTQIPFDQLAKEFLQELLTPLGNVERSFEVPGEAQLPMLWVLASSVSQPVLADANAATKGSQFKRGFPFIPSPLVLPHPLQHQSPLPYSIQFPIAQSLAGSSAMLPVMPIPDNESPIQATLNLVG